MVMSEHKQETLADIVAEKRAQANKIESVAGLDANQFQRELIHDLRAEADRIEAAHKRESNSIERLVRDAIIDYQEMFDNAPNDDAERELVERAERGNAWLVANGYEPEQLSWSKEVSPCL